MVTATPVLPASDAATEAAPATAAMREPSAAVTDRLPARIPADGAPSIKASTSARMVLSTYTPATLTATPV
ncbi:MAG: hypothetical protein FD149_76 [Rhodospirillaceae bacterium]|nr:MAG: hypothetical protein FD149_76 [Rhodospirillaceae bacterium]